MYVCMYTHYMYIYKTQAEFLFLYRLFAKSLVLASRNTKFIIIKINLYNTTNGYSNANY